MNSTVAKHLSLLHVTAPNLPTHSDFLFYLSHSPSPSESPLYKQQVHKMFLAADNPLFSCLYSVSGLSINLHSERSHPNYQLTSHFLWIPQDHQSFQELLPLISLGKFPQPLFHHIGYKTTRNISSRTVENSNECKNSSWEELCDWVI